MRIQVPLRPVHMPANKFSKKGFKRHGKRRAWYATIWTKDHGRVQYNRLSGRFRLLRRPATFLRRTKTVLRNSRLARLRRR